MHRTGFIARVAGALALGTLLRTPLGTEVSEVAETPGAAAESGEAMHMFAGVTEDGQYFSTQLRMGWPNAQTLAQFAKTGFDRFEVVVGNKAIYQAPTIAGKIPVGWDSLEHAGWIR